MVAVQKRVSARLFDICPTVQTNGAEPCFQRRCTARDRYHSPLPGTVVDTTIVSPLFSGERLLFSLRMLLMNR